MFFNCRGAIYCAHLNEHHRMTGRDQSRPYNGTMMICIWVVMWQCHVQGAIIEGMINHAPTKQYDI
jgi:hypothetical protein